MGSVIIRSHTTNTYLGKTSDKRKDIELRANKFMISGNIGCRQRERKWGLANIDENENRRKVINRAKGSERVEMMLGQTVEFYKRYAMLQNENERGYVKNLLNFNGDKLAKSMALRQRLKILKTTRARIKFWMLISKKKRLFCAKCLWDDAIWKA